ncbi:uncharacterized protein PITG_04853 [Phytophthora infestans T30-4]|uniref:Uncharacterized protein n=1 Tax=Phytophthora infestans (strain T30-4) TaxID=403677 RepID=D0N268_PHYIT|nr:uncharacterized protein PITG_04853 [Phytophthora infestans T30-4]EEY68397.1 hypothetical protein PITG_04853 [Phytophthora infestans T30-4]|eukprot:XP_002905556.1 hypothetical protein PITG_04853 [Phytophthora infestans T30-4]
MDAYHPVEVATYLAQAEQLRRGEGAPTVRNLANTFAEVTDRGKKRPLREITAEEQRRVNELLAEWAARHFRPMMIVEDAALQQNEMTSVRTIVQHFRTLAVYSRKSPKGKHRLGAIQVKQLNVKVNDVGLATPLK